MPDDDQVPHATRAFIYAFLVAFIICALAAIEAYPLTGWRLFSHVRTEQQTGWLAVAVDEAGGETEIPFDSFDVAYRGYPQLLARFPAMSSDERARICAAWIARTRTYGIAAERLRIYRTLTDVGARRGERSIPPQRSLAFTCGP